MLLRESALQGARSGHHYGAERNLQRTFRCTAIDLTADDVIDRSRSGEDHAGSDHRLSAHDRPFVDSAVAADDDIVLDDHRKIAHRLQHAADLRAGAEMHAL